MNKSASWLLRVSVQMNAYSAFPSLTCEKNKCSLCNFGGLERHSRHTKEAQQGHKEAGGSKAFI